MQSCRHGLATQHQHLTERKQYSVLHSKLTPSFLLTLAGHTWSMPFFGICEGATFTETLTSTALVNSACSYEDIAPLGEMSEVTATDRSIPTGPQKTSLHLQGQANSAAI